MQRGWVGEVAGLFFFSLQKLFPMRADEVGTNHPIFSFFDSPCLRYRVLHNGSFCQLPEGKPSAPRSISGYSVKSACILSSMSFPGDIILRKYLMMHISKYILRESVGRSIHGLTMIFGLMGRSVFCLFQTRAW